MFESSYNQYEQVFRSIILTSDFYILNSLNQSENINNH